MTIQEFFGERQIVILTPEYLKSMMLAQFADVGDFYEPGEPFIAECSTISVRNVFPVVLMKMTVKEDPTQYDYLYYVPAANSVGIWPGSLEYKEATPYKVGTHFVMALSSRQRINGKIVMYNKQLCFKFKRSSASFKI